MPTKDQVVVFGELLLRLSPPANKKLLQAEMLEMHWAGSEANVGVSLACLGDRAAVLTAVPDNDLGAMAAGTLARYGVNTSLIRKEGDRLGTFFYEQGAGIRNGRIIYDRSHSSFAMLKPGMLDWDAVFDGCGWLHWSGINAGISADLAAVCREGLEAASKKSIFISADCNHRTALWKYGHHPRQVMPDLLDYCQLIVADMTVGNMYYDITPKGEDLVQSFVEQIAPKFSQGAAVALTMRGKISGKGNDTDYAGYLFEGNKLYTSRKYALENVVERIGTGDAFMAGLIYAKRNNFATQQVVDFAAACGAMKHTILGDFNLSSLQEINELINNPRTGAILR